MCKFKDYFLKGTTCHTELSQESEVSIKSKRGYFANAQYDNDLFVIFLPCHTEALAEVSINLKCALNSLDFFATACALQPVGSPFCKRLKMTKNAFIVIHKQGSKHQTKG